MTAAHAACSGEYNAVSADVMRCDGLRQMLEADITPTLSSHMGPEVQNSFKEGARGAQYGKLAVRHQGVRKYVSPNQTYPVF